MTRRDFDYSWPMEAPVPAVVVPEPSRRPLRKGVILAAGFSTRMAPLSNGRSKAMLRLGGLTLLERSIRTLLTLDLEQIMIVIGHDMEVVAEHAKRFGGIVSVIEADGWESGNGCSLATAEPYVKEEDLFLLVTVDHVFAPDALHRLLDARAPAVLVDAAPTPEEWSEGTRVVLEAGRAIAFGKELTSEVIDCGAFLLPSTIFDAHRSAWRRGDPSLAGAVTALVSEHPLTAVPIAPGSWVDIDVPQDLALARDRLRRSLGKPSDGPVSTYLNRPISTRLSMLLAGLPLSPDVVSVLVLLGSLGAALLLASGRGVAGGVAVQAVSVLDGVDGELARLRLRSSPKGAMLDGVLDRLADAAIICGFALWAAPLASTRTVILLTCLALTGSMLSMASKDRAKLLNLPAAPERWIGRLLGGRDGRLLLLAVAALAGRPIAGLAAVAVTSLVALSIRLIYVLRDATAPAGGTPIGRDRSSG
jgi:choline kinase/phosphatidylglycerophosphate synthase